MESLGDDNQLLWEYNLLEFEYSMISSLVYSCYNDAYLLLYVSNTVSTHVSTVIPEVELLRK